MNHSEWQKVHQEETEWALLNIMRLSEEKRIQWKLENFSPAELMQGETANWGYLVQRFEASTFWAGYELSFSSCAMIHVPSGKGNIIIAFVYKNGMSTYFSSLANDEGYEEASTEDLLEIYGGSLIVKGSEIIWDAVKNDANAYIVQEDDIACFQYLPSRIRNNWIVRLSKQLIRERKYTDFQRMVLDTDYRNQLANATACVRIKPKEK